MNRFICGSFILFIFLIFSQQANSQPSYLGRQLSLGEVLQLARQNAVEPLAFQLEKEAIEAEARATEQVFDGRITSYWRKAHDDGPLVQVTYGEKRREDRFETSYQTLFKTGTAVEVSTSWVKQGLAFPFPIAALDPINAPRYNPAHETLVGVAVRQSLWRNWKTREVELGRSIMEGGAIEPTYRSRSQLQDIQGEVEYLYWQLVGLNEQIGLAEKLLLNSKKFAQSMERRREIGRSDDVDVADADSLVIAREADLLNLIVQRDQVKERLRVRLFGQGLSENFHVPQRLPATAPLPLPAQHAQQAIELAKRNRFDLQMLQKQQELADDQLALVRERSLPDIGLFASYHRRGLADNLGNSLEELDRGSLATVGLDMNWTLGQTEKREQSRAALLRKQSLAYHSQAISQIVAQKLRAAFEHLRGAERQRQLAETHISILRNKKNAEERKLRQARSDEVAVLRYEMEAISAEFKKIDAQLRVFLAASEIRALVHAYPQMAERTPARQP